MALVRRSVGRPRHRGGSHKTGPDTSGLNVAAGYRATGWLAVGLVWRHLRVNMSAGISPGALLRGYPPLRAAVTYRP
jgi:hypothetical protein